MKIFASNESIAKSRFWYFLKKTHKLKKVKGEIILVKEIIEDKNSFVKNFGIWIRYETRTGITNMFKEYRDNLTCGAVEQMYTEMAGRHKAKWNSIIILRVEKLNPHQCIRAQIKQFHNPKIKFPLTNSIYRHDSINLYSNFKASRPFMFS
jgi:large subunit ribosomal protein L18Ae